MTLLRRAEYDALSHLEMRGRVIDLGGTHRATYHTLLKGSFAVEVANNNAAAMPDILCDFEKPLPINDQSYDGALVINVLEHIFEYRAFIAEIKRILKPGGKLIVVVPYLFPYHASPNDFHRYSASALKRALELAGFGDIHAQPLGTGICAARWQLLERLLPAPLRFLSAVALPMTALGDWALCRLGRLLRKSYHPSDYALGFVVTASARP